ncbi:MAG: Rrf2 family transcriptional regulator [Geovibrio sp.]|jgi:Rrf2 family protein|uniref:RrF2 family transcriptional regulator n=1 Tax=Geovibrio ferrireducens TaxID=46201 RepID=UPI0022460263|nr:Rrf2 family transcriptional regulator [Geovibrio ferrireducens]MCD8568394.1 Rrf2 family transcriptional regulator [Geovibrio sp.]
MFSMKTVYGLKALQYLAVHGAGRHVLISEVAEKEGIPKKFLETILLTLKNDGLLISKIGKGGGYQLAVAPSEITMERIIRALEGPVALVPCVTDENSSKCDYCEDFATCGVRLSMTRITDKLINVMSQTTLADMLEDVERAIQSKRNIHNYVI